MPRNKLAAVLLTPPVSVAIASVMGFLIHPNDLHRVQEIATGVGMLALIIGPVCFANLLSRHCPRSRMTFLNFAYFLGQSTVALGVWWATNYLFSQT